MGGFDWKKTGKKFVWSLAFVFISGALALVTERPEWIFLVPVLEATRNVLKRKLDWVWL